MDCQQHRLGDMTITATMTGLRKSELLALEWSAINLSEGVLAVRRAIKEIAGSLVTKEH